MQNLHPYTLNSNTFSDERGSLKVLWKMDNKFNCIQENLVYSKKNVIRGLHFQKKFQQSKLVTCLEGEVFDVCVDLRSNSNKFSHFYCFRLNNKKSETLYVPKGFAHGFLTLSNNSIVSYKVDNFYRPKYEVTLKWNDKNLNIPWPKKNNILLSKKDIVGLKLEEIKPL